MKFEREKVDQIAAKLKALPPAAAARQLTKQGAILELHSDIERLQSSGYSVDEIAKTLSGEGLAIAPATLKNYLLRARANATRKRAGIKQGTKAEAAGGATKTQVAAPQKASAQLVAGAAPATRGQLGSKKATFVPIEDSKDL